jgi:tetratricopeptide (TPR) repeat protein
MKVDALVEEKMFDEALAVTDDLIDANEKPVSLWQQSQITVYMQMEKPEDALNAAKQYAIKMPENKLFYDGLTIQPLLASKQYDKAIATAESLIQAVPKDKKISAVLVLIQCYQQAGRYDAAIDFAKKQLSQYPGSSLISVSLHQQIVRSLELAGRFNEAEKYILIQHDKSEGEVKNQWQQILTADFFAAGRNDRAIRLLETILSVNPNLGWANNSLGYALANNGKDYKRAEALIRKAAATEPGLGAYLDSLGWVLYRQGKYEQAYKYALMAYRSMNEPDPVILDHLGDICFALKKYDQARQYWQESIRSSKDRDITTLEPGMPDRTIKKLKRLK